MVHRSVLLCRPEKQQLLDAFLMLDCRDQLLLAVCIDIILQDNDIVHRNSEDLAQGAEIIHTREVFPALPVVNRLMLFRAKEQLKVPDSEPTVLPQLLDFHSGSLHIDHREINDLRHRSHLAFPLCRSVLEGLNCGEHVTELQIVGLAVNEEEPAALTLQHMSLRIDPLGANFVNLGTFDLTAQPNLISHHFPFSFIKVKIFILLLSSFPLHF